MPLVVISSFGWLILILVVYQAREQIVIFVFLLVVQQNIYSILRVKVANFPSFGSSQLLYIFLRLLVDYLQFPLIELLSLFLSPVFEELPRIKLRVDPHLLVGLILLLSLLQAFPKVLIGKYLSHVSSSDFELGILLIILSFSRG